jgi:hypothetical protein
MKSVWGAHAPSRAGDWRPRHRGLLLETGGKTYCGEGAATRTRGRVRSPEFSSSGAIIFTMNIGASREGEAPAESGRDVGRCGLAGASPFLNADLLNP